MSHRQYFADLLIGALRRGVTFLTVEQRCHARKVEQDHPLINVNSIENKAAVIGQHVIGLCQQRQRVAGGVGALF